MKQAAELFLDAGLPARAGQILLDERLPQEDPLSAKIIQALLKEESWEKLGSIYERYGDIPKAVNFLAKAGVFQRAVELSRSRAPELVLGLEEKWGDALCQDNMKEQAINHFVEAKQPIKAIEAAIGARQWGRAGVLVNGLGGEEGERFCIRIAEQLERSKQYELAEKYFVKGKKATRGFAMWVNQGRLREARKFASENFKQEEIAELWLSSGRQAEKEKRYEEAEKLFVEGGKPELAIKMYKTASLWDKMLKLFSLYRPENLKEAHILVGRRLEEEEQLAKAEKHYIEADSWSLAVDMYEKRRNYEDCLRMLKNHANERDTVERLKRWDASISHADLVALLKRLGLRDILIDLLAEKKLFEEAFREAQIAKHKKCDVHLAYAMHLEDEKNFREAERHYVLANKFD